MGDLLAPLSSAVAEVDADSIARQHTVSPAELDRHFLSHGSSVHFLRGTGFADNTNGRHTFDPFEHVSPWASPNRGVSENIDLVWIKNAILESL